MCQKKWTTSRLAKSPKNKKMKKKKEKGRGKKRKLNWQFNELDKAGWAQSEMMNTEHAFTSALTVGIEPSLL